jgi:hypothetical protein
MMKKNLLYLLIFANLFLVSTLLSHKPASAGWFDFLYAKSLEVKVVGNNFYANNVLLRLRGVAMGDPHDRVSDFGRDANADYGVISREWLGNAVRLSVHPGVWRRDQNRGKEILEEEIAAARRNNLIVIVDWHVIGTPDGWYKQMELGPRHSYTYESSMSTARDFWHYMAMRYSGDQGVMFELWNEPAREPATWKVLRPYMQELTDGIRGRGANNVIIAPGAWWTYDLRGIKENPLKGRNIAYAWHNYPGNSKMYISWTRALADLNDKYPIVVTEWGYSDDRSDPYTTKGVDFGGPFQKFMYDEKLSFTAWCWHPRWKPAMLQEDWRTPNSFGAAVKRYMTDLAKGKYAPPKKIAVKKQGPEPINALATNFIIKGIDQKSRKIGINKRRDLVYNYYKAKGKFPGTQKELNELMKNVN